MMDQSHNITDPIESLIASAAMVRKTYAQACIVNREKLVEYQTNNDAMMAHKTLTKAFESDVGPIVRMARYRTGGAIEPIEAYRKSGYRKQKAKLRPQVLTGSSGIV
jgi:L-rhamnose isomerase/sugar isomerase